jgi:hypothetical protein
MMVRVTKVLLMMAVVAGGCAAAPAQEKGMKLELVTTTQKEKDETIVKGVLRNTGSEPVNILQEFMLSRSYGKLTDDAGKELKPHDASAARGQRAFGIKPIKTHPLKPGEEVEIGTFSLSSDGYAQVGDYSWELKAGKYKSLTIELIYEVTEEAARIAKQHKAPDVAVGKWTSKPVALSLQK